jgi:hypothetical protein
MGVQEFLVSGAFTLLLYGARIRAALSDGTSNA